MLAGLSTEDHLPFEGIRVPGIGKVHRIRRQVEIEFLAPAFQQKGARDLGTGAVPVFMDGVLSAVFADADFHVPVIPVLSGDGDQERKTYELLAVLACADGGVAADCAVCRNITFYHLVLFLSET